VSTYDSLDAYPCDLSGARWALIEPWLAAWRHALTDAGVGGRAPHHRRLVRDYETRPDNSASMITIAMIDNFAKRVTAETTFTWRYG